jgi:hypothetical protein
MVSVLNQSDIRRAAASAGLLASDNAGERANAAAALSRILLKMGLDPASVFRAALATVSSPAKAELPMPKPVRPMRPLSERARMARHSPHLNRWERDFLTGVMDRRRLSEREESKLRDILRKTKGVGDER